MQFGFLKEKKTRHLKGQSSFSINLNDLYVFLFTPVNLCVMTAAQDLTTDLFCFRHLYKPTVRGSSGPEELIRLTNTWTEQRFPFDLIFKHILTVTASENQVALLSQCLTDPKDTQKICAGVKN